MSSTSDYTLYALFTYNFIKFTKWPNQPKEILIGVYNNSNTGEAMEKMARVKTSPSLSLKVIIIKEENQAEAARCQLLFFPSGNREKATQLIKKLENNTILVVTEDADFYQKGADIIFKVVADKLRFVINVESLKSKDLQIAGSLLSLSNK